VLRVGELLVDQCRESPGDGCAAIAVPELDELADLVTRETGATVLTHFSFRAKSAFFLGEKITLLGKRNDREVDLAALTEHGVVGLTAAARL